LSANNLDSTVNVYVVVNEWDSKHLFGSKEIVHPPIYIYFFTLALKLF